MLKVEAGCDVFMALVEAENPVRSIKLPNPSTACYMLSTINHCCAAAAGECASVPEVFWQGAMPLGLMATVWRRGFTAVVKSQPLGSRLAHTMDECICGRCGWRGCTAPPWPPHFTVWCVSLDLAGFLLGLICRSMSYSSCLAVGEGTEHTSVAAMAPRAPVTSSCSSVCNPCVQSMHLHRAVLTVQLVEHLQIFQSFEYFSHTNFIKWNKFFLIPLHQSHPQSIQTTVSHHIPVHKPGQTTSPCTVYAQCYMGCCPPAKGWEQIRAEEKGIKHLIRKK